MRQINCGRAHTSRTNLSSAGISVTAVNLVQLSGNATADVIDAGNANPENNFRFDPTLGATGGYIFNMSTRGLSTGTYVMAIAVAGDPTTHATEVSFQVR